MSMSQTSQLQIGRKEAAAAVALGDDLIALTKNRAFTRLVEQGYFRDEAHRLVMTKAHPNAQDPQVQLEITKDIDGIGSFYQYLNTVGSKANDMRPKLAEYDAAISASEDAGE